MCKLRLKAPLCHVGISHASQRSSAVAKPPGTQPPGHLHGAKATPSYTRWSVAVVDVQAAAEGTIVLHASARLWQHDGLKQPHHPIKP